MATIIGYVVHDDGTMTPTYDNVVVEDPEAGSPETTAPDYGSLSKKQLEDEVKLRNSERKTDDVDYIVVDAPGNKPELVAALTADDQVED